MDEHVGPPGRNYSNHISDTRVAQNDTGSCHKQLALSSALFYTKLTDPESDVDESFSSFATDLAFSISKYMTEVHGVNVLLSMIPDLVHHAIYVLCRCIDTVEHFAGRPFAVIRINGMRHSLVCPSSLSIALASGRNFEDRIPEFLDEVYKTNASTYKSLSAFMGANSDVNVEMSRNIQLNFPSLRDTCISDRQHSRDLHRASLVIKGGPGHVNRHEGSCDLDAEEEEDAGAKPSIALINPAGVFKESDVGEGEKNFTSIFSTKSPPDGVFEDIRKVLSFGLFSALVNKPGTMLDNQGDLDKLNEYLSVGGKSTNPRTNYTVLYKKARVQMEGSKGKNAKTKYRMHVVGFRVSAKKGGKDVAIMIYHPDYFDPMYGDPGKGINSNEDLYRLDRLGTRQYEDMAWGWDEYAKNFIRRTDAETKNTNPDLEVRVRSFQLNPRHPDDLKRISEIGTVDRQKKAVKEHLRIIPRSLNRLRKLQGDLYTNTLTLYVIDTLFRSRRPKKFKEEIASYENPVAGRLIRLSSYLMKSGGKGLMDNRRKRLAIIRRGLDLDKTGKKSGSPLLLGIYGEYQSLPSSVDSLSSTDMNKIVESIARIYSKINKLSKGVKDFADSLIDPIAFYKKLLACLIDREVFHYNNLLQSENNGGIEEEDVKTTGILIGIQEALPIICRAHVKTGKTNDPKEIAFDHLLNSLTDHRLTDIGEFARCCFNLVELEDGFTKTRGYAKELKFDKFWNEEEQLDIDLRSFWKVYDTKRIGPPHREKNHTIDVDFIEEDDESFDGDSSSGIYGGEASFTSEDSNIEEEEDRSGEDYYTPIDDVGSSSGNVDDDEEIGDSSGTTDEPEEDSFLSEKTPESTYFTGKGKEKEGTPDDEELGIQVFSGDIRVEYDGKFGDITIDSIPKYILKAEFENNLYGSIPIIIYFADDYKTPRPATGANLLDSESIISGAESIVGDINDLKTHGSIDDLTEDKADSFSRALANNDEDFEKMIDKQSLSYLKNVQLEFLVRFFALWMNQPVDEVHSVTQDELTDQGFTEELAGKLEPFLFSRLVADGKKIAPFVTGYLKYLLNPGITRLPGDIQYSLLDVKDQALEILPVLNLDDSFSSLPPERRTPTRIAGSAGRRWEEKPLDVDQIPDSRSEGDEAGDSGEDTFLNPQVSEEEESETSILEPEEKQDDDEEEDDGFGRSSLEESDVRDKTPVSPLGTFTLDEPPSTPSSTFPSFSDQAPLGGGVDAESDSTGLVDLPAPSSSFSSDVDLVDPLPEETSLNFEETLSPILPVMDEPTELPVDDDSQISESPTDIPLEPATSPSDPLTPDPEPIPFGESSTDEDTTPDPIPSPPSTPASAPSPPSSPISPPVEFQKADPEVTPILTPKQEPDVKEIQSPPPDVVEEVVVFDNPPRVVQKDKGKEKEEKGGPITRSRTKTRKKQQVSPAKQDESIKFSLPIEVYETLFELMHYAILTHNPISTIYPSIEALWSRLVPDVPWGLSPEETHKFFLEDEIQRDETVLNDLRDFISEEGGGTLKIGSDFYDSFSSITFPELISLGYNYQIVWFSTLMRSVLTFDPLSGPDRRDNEKSRVIFAKIIGGIWRVIYNLNRRGNELQGPGSLWVSRNTSSHPVDIEVVRKVLIRQLNVGGVIYAKMVLNQFIYPVSDTWSGSARLYSNSFEYFRRCFSGAIPAKSDMDIPGYLFLLSFYGLERNVYSSSRLLRLNPKDPRPVINGEGLKNLCKTTSWDTRSETSDVLSSHSSVGSLKNQSFVTMAALSCLVDSLSKTMSSDGIGSILHAFFAFYSFARLYSGRGFDDEVVERRPKIVAGTPVESRHSYARRSLQGVKFPERFVKNVANACIDRKNLTDEPLHSDIENSGENKRILQTIAWMCLKAFQYEEPGSKFRLGEVCDDISIGNVPTSNQHIVVRRGDPFPGTGTPELFRIFGTVLFGQGNDPFCLSGLLSLESRSSIFRSTYLYVKNIYDGSLNPSGYNVVDTMFDPLIQSFDFSRKIEVDVEIGKILRSDSEKSDKAKLFLMETETYPGYLLYDKDSPGDAGEYEDDKRKGVFKNIKPEKDIVKALWKWAEVAGDGIVNHKNIRLGRVRKFIDESITGFLELYYGAELNGPVKSTEDYLSIFRYTFVYLLSLPIVTGERCSIPHLETLFHDLDFGYPFTKSYIPRALTNYYRQYMEAKHSGPVFEYLSSGDATKKFDPNCEELILVLSFIVLTWAPEFPPEDHIGYPEADGTKINHKAFAVSLAQNVVNDHVLLEDLKNSVEALMKLNRLFVEWILGTPSNILTKAHETNTFVYHEYLKSAMTTEIDLSKPGSYEPLSVCKALLDYRDMHTPSIWRFNDGRKVMADRNDPDWYPDYMFGN